MKYMSLSGADGLRNPNPIDESIYFFMFQIF